MTNAETRARTMLDAWRERGADGLDSVRFRFIEALERRAAAQNGEARRVLDERLAGLLEAYAAEVEKADANANANAGAKPSRGPLGDLLDHIENEAPAGGRASYPELELLEYFRQTWSSVSADKQVRQSLEQVPGNAGPLNSSSLVHRSLSLMRELSPGYLQHFLSYVDALSWMEQLNGAGAPATKDAPRAANARKNARARPR
ncbi:MULTISPECIES: DUF2894 domain-containing protein [unclassified Caballeronia]|uniref:DUF2894 domain-containing protein n=1 Tax=unclassified Caballeronia TaxID=2646786 RepID=UPI002865EB19|nr:MULTISPECIES: DUF2894 domain-containing protein [unclassified Caballeronia]MDR5753505.1 DUF2894 domain-containing protein [Caballeronia sp. LZ024]MDR5839884.1 DUF2894 domain-containing protein [Caballeronia sp. LZ031]